MQIADYEYRGQAIYQIYCKNSEITETYVGSTNCYQVRMDAHIKHLPEHWTKDGQMKVYRFIRAHGGAKNWAVRIVERPDCLTTDNERHAREGEVQEELGATLCVRRARGLTKKENDAIYNSKDSTKLRRNEYQRAYRARKKAAAAAV